MNEACKPMFNLGTRNNVKFQRQKNIHAKISESEVNNEIENNENEYGYQIHTVKAQDSVISTPVIIPNRNQQAHLQYPVQPSNMFSINMQQWSGPNVNYQPLFYPHFYPGYNRPIYSHSMPVQANQQQSNLITVHIQDNTPGIGNINVNTEPNHCNSLQPEQWNHQISNITSTYNSTDSLNCTNNKSSYCVNENYYQNGALNDIHSFNQANH